MIRDYVSFALDTYLVLIEDNNLGEAPTTLGGGEQWYPDEEAAHRRENAYAELQRIGVFRNGRVDDEFMETIHVLHRPGREYYTYANVGGRSITGRTAAIGRDAVLAVRTGETIELYPGQPEQLPQQLIYALPENNPATVHSMSCQYDDYAAAMEGKPVASSQSGRDAKQLARWMSMEPLNYGELYAAIRKPQGGSAQAESVPRWVDTEQGRILAYLDGSGYVNLVTGSPEKMIGRLQQMEADLRGR